MAQSQDGKMLASETTYSSEDEVIESLPLQFTHSINGPKLDFEHDGFPWRDINIRRNDGSLAYFADISVFSRKVPDIILYSNSKEGPIVAVSHFSRALSIKCGLGSNELSRDWIEMKRSGAFGSTRYRFEYGERKYSLRRTRDAGHGVSGINRVLMSHYQVIDDDSGDTLAVYITSASIGKRKGSLTLVQGVSQELEVLIVIVVASWREKARRRHAAGGGNAGGTSG